MRRAMCRPSRHYPPPAALRALSRPVMRNLYLYCLFGDHTNSVINYKLLLLAGNTGRSLFLNGPDSSTYRGKSNRLRLRRKVPLQCQQSYDHSIDHTKWLTLLERIIATKRHSTMAGPGRGPHAKLLLLGLFPRAARLVGYFGDTPGRAGDKLQSIHIYLPGT
jgi:hypothetical protein